MSFIGNVPAEAYSPVAKDTFSGNGSTTDFTLSIPATTNSVEVFVENVQQEPTDAYTISGTTLSFTAAPVTGTDNIYVIHRGPAVQQVVPPAGVALNPSTVTATDDISTEGDLKVEVSSGGIYTITGTDTASNRTLTLPDEAGTVLTSSSDIVTNYGPLFRAARGPSSSQTISHNTVTKVQFDVDVIDTDNCYDTSTYRFTPTTAGYYHINLHLVVQPPSGSNFSPQAQIYKNGARQISHENSIGSIGSGLNQSFSVSLVAEANGTTDYFEAYFYHFDYTGSASSYVLGAADYRLSSFQGYLVRAL